MNEYFVERNCCPICQSPEASILRSIPFTEPPIRDYLKSFYAQYGRVEFEYLSGSRYILCECDSCGLIYQKQVPNEFLMSKLYEEWIDPEKVYEILEKRREVEYFAAMATEVASVIGSIGRPPGELTFFDFGMGWGHWCRIAMGFGCNVYGYELSKARIVSARALGIKVISWEEIPDHQFDYVNMEQIVEHLAEPLETLRHVRTALKPGGLVKIGVPDGRGIKRRLTTWDWSAPKGTDDSLNPVAPLEHLNCFDPERGVMDELARRVDLRPARIEDPHEAQTILDNIKSILRPYYHAIRRRESPRPVHRFFRDAAQT